MSGSQDYMTSFEYRDDSFRGETALSCYLGKVFYIQNHRNTWQGSRSYCMVWNPYFTALDRAKNAAEPMRAQGLTWTIWELPAIAIAGRNRTLIVADRSATPMQDYVDVQFDERDERTVEQIELQFKPKRSDWVARLITSNDAIGPAELPFKTYRSFSQGAKHSSYLGWTPWKTEFDSRGLDSMFELVKRINLHLQNG